MHSIFGASRKLAQALLTQPEASFEMASGLARIATSGTVFVSDNQLEEHVVKLLEPLEHVREVTLYGRPGMLRSEMEVCVSGSWFSVVIDLIPGAVTWGSAYSASFQYRLVRWEAASSAMKVMATGVKELLFSAIPFGGLVQACAEYAFDKVVQEVGFQQALGAEPLAASGVTVGGGEAVVDLQRQPKLALLWSPPPFPLPLAPLLPAQPAPCLAELIVVSDLRADREGLHVGVKPSAAGRALLMVPGRAVGLMPQKRTALGENRGESAPRPASEEAPPSASTRPVSRSETSVESVRLGLLGRLRAWWAAKRPPPASD